MKHLLSAIIIFLTFSISTQAQGLNIQLVKSQNNEKEVKKEKKKKPKKKSIKKEDAYSYLMIRKEYLFQ
ncbi:hypothetical protein [Flammeovirga pacifica]|uniref:Uncharacterized protein n=1 Tax=Flammeovirga pacifica TaxID=915059 RepID=A0A1S1YTN8_FLAPC|nr:hypothetical protein [Flammeovirga pacifica]OHX64165.1 hypothetical protein NH26_21410 [Flammeovirga pacifica]